MELYPLKFEEIFKKKIWGSIKLNRLLGKKTGGKENIGESWEISGVEDNVSVVSNGFLAGNNLQEVIEVYMGSIVGEKNYEKFGFEFPLLIKFIDANDVLSIQVHPDDKTAKKRHNAYGKTEMWYIIEAEKDAEIITGFNKKTNKEEYSRILLSGNLKDLLNIEKANKNDVYYIPAGRVHAIGKGIVLAEIQQTSDITYRIYDWGRLGSNGKPRELHTDLAIDVIDYNYYKSYKTKYNSKKDKTSNIIESEYFNTNILEFDKKIKKDYNLIDSFVIFMCIEGDFDIEYNKNFENCKKGETILIPAELKNINLLPKQKSKIIEIYIA